MKRNRGRLEIVSVILHLSINEIKKTHIMYRANLSHRQLEKYLEFLVKKQLLAKKDDSYVTTPWGLEFIEKFGEIQALLEKSENERAIVQLASLP